jgi:hypothetical protein
LDPALHGINDLITDADYFLIADLATAGGNLKELDVRSQADLSVAAPASFKQARFKLVVQDGTNAGEREAVLSVMTGISFDNNYGAGATDNQYKFGIFARDSATGTANSSAIVNVTITVKNTLGMRYTGQDGSQTVASVVSNGVVTHNGTTNSSAVDFAFVANIPVVEITGTTNANGATAAISAANLGIALYGKIGAAASQNKTTLVSNVKIEDIPHPLLAMRSANTVKKFSFSLDTLATGTVYTLTMPNYTPATTHQNKAGNLGPDNGIINGPNSAFNIKLATPSTGLTDGTYTGVTTTVLPSGGSGATFDVTVAGGTVTTVTASVAGSGYSNDDVLTLDNTNIGGTAGAVTITYSPSISFVFTYDETSNHILFNGPDSVDWPRGRPYTEYFYHKDETMTATASTFAAPNAYGARHNGEAGNIMSYYNSVDPTSQNGSIGYFTWTVTNEAGGQTSRTRTVTIKEDPTDATTRYSGLLSRAPPELLQDKSDTLTFAGTGSIATQPAALTYSNLKKTGSPGTNALGVNLTVSRTTELNITQRGTLWAYATTNANGTTGNASFSEIYKVNNEDVYAHNFGIRTTDVSQKSASWLATQLGTTKATLAVTFRSQSGKQRNDAFNLSITQNPVSLAANATYYPGVTTTVLPSGGSGATFNVTVTAGTISAVTVAAQGTGYATSDVLTIAHADIGGTSTSVNAVTVTTTPSTGLTDGTHTGVTTTVLPSGGSGATFDVTVAGGTITAVTANATGTGYATGNVLTLDNTNIGGTAGAATITITVPTPTNATITYGLDTGAIATWDTAFSVYKSDATLSTAEDITGARLITMTESLNHNISIDLSGLNIDSVITQDFILQATSTFDPNTSTFNEHATCNIKMSKSNFNQIFYYKPETPGITTAGGVSVWSNLMSSATLRSETIQLLQKEANWPVMKSENKLGTVSGSTFELYDINAAIPASASTTDPKFEIGVPSGISANPLSIPDIVVENWTYDLFGVKEMADIFSSTAQMKAEIQAYLTSPGASISNTGTFEGQIRTKLAALSTATSTGENNTQSQIEARPAQFLLYALRDNMGSKADNTGHYRLTTSMGGMFHPSNKITSGGSDNGFFPFLWQAGDKITVGTNFKHVNVDAGTLYNGGGSNAQLGDLPFKYVITLE